MATPWLRSARTAVSAVDKTQLFELQRAAVQDAFRTVSAAFAMLSTTESRPLSRAEELHAVPVRAPGATTTISGELIGIDTLPSSGIEKFKYLQVRTSDGLVLVETGPAWFVDAHPIPAQPGDAIEVSGIATEAGAVTHLIASFIKGPNGVLRLRDLEGRASW